MTGRHGDRSPAWPTFGGSPRGLFWFWIWGPVGLFLAVPLLSSIRAACAHLPRLKLVSQFLAE